MKSMVGMLTVGLNACFPLFFPGAGSLGRSHKGKWFPGFPESIIFGPWMSRYFRRTRCTQDWPFLFTLEALEQPSFLVWDALTLSSLSHFSPGLSLLQCSTCSKKTKNLAKMARLMIRKVLWFQFLFKNQFLKIPFLCGWWRPPWVGTETDTSHFQKWQRHSDSSGYWEETHTTSMRCLEEGLSSVSPSGNHLRVWLLLTCTTITPSC